MHTFLKHMLLNALLSVFDITKTTKYFVFSWLSFFYMCVINEQWRYLAFSLIKTVYFP